ncbi:hypothetical protein DFH06DRAFT_1317290 [Mycena polygramma]|nr:hypothetical protein DFH06DRAFT_1317290 [Mycena polygramma]
MIHLVSISLFAALAFVSAVGAQASSCDNICPSPFGRLRLAIYILWCVHRSTSPYFPPLRHPGFPTSATLSASASASTSSSLPIVTFSESQTFSDPFPSTFSPVPNGVTFSTFSDPFPAPSGAAQRGRVDLAVAGAALVVGGWFL